jgi:hypothetical protein
MRVVQGHDRVRACKGTLRATISKADSDSISAEIDAVMRRQGIPLV